MISDGDKKLLAEARQKLSDKDIGRTNARCKKKKKGIEGVIQTESTERNKHDRD